MNTAEARKKAVQMGIDGNPVFLKNFKT